MRRVSPETDLIALQGSAPSSAGVSAFPSMPLIAGSAPALHAGIASIRSKGYGLFTPLADQHRRDVEHSIIEGSDVISQPARIPRAFQFRPHFRHGSAGGKDLQQGGLEGSEPRGRNVHPFAISAMREKSAR